MPILPPALERGATADAEQADKSVGRDSFPSGPFDAGPPPRAPHTPPPPNGFLCLMFVPDDGSRMEQL